MKNFLQASGQRPNPVTKGTRHANEASVEGPDPVATRGGRRNGPWRLGASAKWLLLRNKVSVSSLKLVGSSELSSELLVGDLEINIHCGGAAAEATLQTKDEGKTLFGSGVATFTECISVDFEEVCVVRSPTQSVGTIEAVGSGLGKMEGGKTFTQLASSEFTVVIYEGEECPLTEIDGKVSGEGVATLLNPETEEKVHTVEINETNLFFGENPVHLHKKEEPISAIKVNAEEESGEPWAIRLVNL